MSYGFWLIKPPAILATVPASLRHFFAHLRKPKRLASSGLFVEEEAIGPGVFEVLARSAAGEVFVVFALDSLSVQPFQGL